MIVISVVRNIDLYDKLVRNNNFFTEARFELLDNREVNETIPCRYNEFLNSYDYEQENWFVFCHEDWELKEDLAARLNSIPKDSLYGPIGCVRDEAIICEPFPVLGQIWESERDGSNVRHEGVFTSKMDVVGTFDCQCLIVHSSLIKKYNLRFDEKLTFDLYVEDFCMNALCKNQINSRILQIECQHYSRGNILPRFHVQHKYLRKKYNHIQHTFFTTSSRKYIGNQRIQRMIYTMMTNCVKCSMRKNGDIRFKICKVPMPVFCSNKLENLFRRFLRANDVSNYIYTP